MRKRLMGTTALSGPLAELVMDVAMAVLVERVKAGRENVRSLSVDSVNTVG